MTTAAAENPAGTKRTRSQTTLDQFAFVNLAHSPLKQARSALRHPPPPDAAAVPPDGALKSPAKDAALGHERDAKRQRHDAPVFPRKPAASLSALANDALPQQPSSAFRRAVSVPPISSSIPLLDLNNVPPSPRRSPTKFRIASVPPEQPSSPPPLPKLSIESVPTPPRPSSPPSPLSPLSPLPQTEDDSMPLDPAPTPSTSDPKPSRLPQPSVVARMKPKQPPQPKKTRNPRPSKPAGPIRMTRSASLRQKKVEEDAKAKAAPTAAPAPTPHRRRSMSLSSYAQPTAASSAKASPVKPASSRPSTAAPSAPFTFTSTLTPRVSHTTPSALSVNRASSGSNALPGPSNVKLHQPRPPDSSTGASGPPLHLNSSLSTLNQALERLNAPPPSRPNTSMGFHRDPLSDDDDDEGDRAALRSSSGAGGRPSNALSTSAKGKPPFVPSTPAQSAKVGPSTARGLPSEKKTLKQTTLMLPPPIPSPDKARAATRNAAQGARDAEAGDDAEARKKQVNLALAPSLSKVRSSLGYALPSMAGAELQAAAPKTGLVTPSVKRAFPAATSSAGRTLFGGVGAASGIARPSSAGAHASARPGLGATAGAGPRNAGAGVFGARRALGMGGRVVHRVSKKSSLPVVIGSPVKGGGGGGQGGDADEEMDLGEGPSAPAEGEEGGQTTKDRIGEWLRNASEDVLRDLGHIDGAGAGEGEGAMEGQDTANAAGPSEDGAAHRDDKEERREREWRRNASRRASMASQLLSQSLSALPDTPSRDAAVPDAKGKGRAVSSSWPAPGAEPRGAEGEENGKGKGKENADGVEHGDGEMPPPPPPPRPTRAHNTRLATGALVATPPGGGEKAKAKTKEEKTAESQSPSALAVLRGCTIFVDVRTDEGDDAGGLFVDMLRGLGAKIATRVGSRCTHVVYKNGLMSTISRYRLVKEPKPLVVGIAWVVECVEQRARVDEARFLVNLELANVAGVNKRRKSMLPKSLLASPGADVKTAGGSGGVAASPASSDSSFRTNGTAARMVLHEPARYARSSVGDRSVEVSSPPAMGVDEDGDSSMQSNGAGHSVLPQAGMDDEESLPPLEKARRRRSMLPAR